MSKPYRQLSNKQYELHRSLLPLTIYHLLCVIVHWICLLLVMTPGFLHSAKGGAVETGCSGLHDVIYQFTTTPIHCTPDPLHPPLQSIQVWARHRQTSRIKYYGEFSKFHVYFCGLDPGNLKFETVRTNKQHICFQDLRRSIEILRFEIMKTDRT